MPNPLSTILDTGKSLFASFARSRATSVVGIDIGSSAIKVVQLKKEAGRLVLETYGAISLGPYAGSGSVGEVPTLSQEILKTAITDVLKESNVTTKEAIFSIQAGGSLVFVIDLPNVEDRELKTTVPNEARKYIPVPITEVSLDWWPIPRHHIENVEDAEEEAKSPTKREVLVAAIRNEVMENYRELVTMSGLSAVGFEIEVFSTIRSSFEHEMTPVVLVDFGAGSTRIAIVEYGVVKKFHTVSRGSYALSESLATALTIPFGKAEELKKNVGLSGGEGVEHGDEIRKIMEVGTNNIFSEINSVILSYEKTYSKAIGKIIFVGGGARMKGFLERAQKDFSFPVTFGDPFKKTKSPEFLKDVLAEAGPEFAVAVGLALKGLEE